MRKGFTLLELACVLAVMGILVAATVPTYDVLVRRARASEARALVEAIAHAELQHFRDRGAFLACPATGEVPRGPTAFPSDEPCWRELGVRFDGPVRYRYGVALDADSYVVTAEGDLDRDGQVSSYTLHGRDLHVDVLDALE